MWQKHTSTAPESYAQTLVRMFGRYEDQQRRPWVFELIMTFQNYEQQLPPLCAAVSSNSRVEDRLLLHKKLFPSTNLDDPIVVSETTDEGQSPYRPPGLMKDLFKLVQSYSLPVSSKVSAIRHTCIPAQTRNNSKITPRVSMWHYLYDHREDMRKWHDQPTPVLRAWVREL